MAATSGHRVENAQTWITALALLAARSDPGRAAAKCAFEAMMPMKKIDVAAIEAARRG